MDRRIELQTELETLLGSRQVYFQPPTTVKMAYPSIVYHMLSVDTHYANNELYLRMPGYSVTLIDKNPDSPYVNKLVNFQYSTFDRHFVVDNLNHFAFTIYK